MTQIYKTLTGFWNSSIWEYERATITVKKGDTINIEAFAGTPKSRIAVDDVLVVDHACAPAGSCNFEEDMCGFKNRASKVNALWIRNSGSTPSKYTGPKVDHTTGKYDRFRYLKIFLSMSGLFLIPHNSLHRPLRTNFYPPNFRCIFK